MEDNSIQYFLLLATLCGVLVIITLVVFKYNDRYWDNHFQELEESLKEKKGENDESR